VPKKKKHTISSAKIKAWKQFSQYIRLRDCLRTTRTSDEGVCVSCPARIPFNKSTAGHFVPDRSRYLLFDEEGVHLQCMQCNIYKKGNWVPYERFMLGSYGQETVDRIKANKYRSGTWDVPTLQEIEQKYKEKFLDLAKKS